MPSTWTVRATGGPSSIDLDEVRRALDILVDKEHWVELRGLPSGRSRVVHGSDLDGLVKAAEELGDDRNIYYCINPVVSQNTSGSNGAAKKDDIAKRRWFFIDVDPVKPDPDFSATNEEKEAARIVAESILSYLSDQEWPSPILIDSGNGWHILYRIDLPNTPHSQALLRATLQRLAKKFDSEGAKVDRAVHNASRIAKLPGTWARKKEQSSKDRPYRKCTFVHVPDEPKIVKSDLIQSLSQEEVVKKPEPQKTKSASIKERNGFKVAASSEYLAYAKEALDRECARVKFAVPGPEEGRNNALNRAGFSMGQLVGAGAILRQDVVSSLRLSALIAGLSEEEIERTLPRAVADGEEYPREMPVRKEEVKEPLHTPGERLTIGAGEVEPMNVRWLWRGRIPIGKLTTWAGRTGLGKSFVTCDIAARLSVGGEIPFSNGECFERGGTLIVNTEDDYSDTLIPRLIECGADRSMIRFFKTEKLYKWTLGDFDTLEKAIKETPKCRLVVIDPSTAHLGGKSGDSNTELREVLTPLMLRTQKWDCAVVLVTHFNKSGGSNKNSEAIARVIGSVAWVAAVRAASAFVPHTSNEDRTRALFIPLKSNLSKKPMALAYRIANLDGNEERAHVEWIEEVDLTADEAMAEEQKAKSDRRTNAKQWLTEFFQTRLEAPSNEIKELARQAGISNNAIWDASKVMPIRRTQRHAPGGVHYWAWIWEGEVNGTTPTQSDDASF